MNDDTLVDELDVYWQSSKSDTLHIFQYLLRPVGTSILRQNETISECKCKTSQNRFELSIALNQQSAAYEKLKAESLAAPGTPRIDKVVLESEPQTKGFSPFVVATVCQSKVYLMPVTSCVQFRPRFDHMQKIAPLPSSVQDRMASDVEGETSQEDEEQSRAPVAVGTRVESEAARARRLGSYEYRKSKLDEIAWVRCEWHDFYSYQSQLFREQLPFDVKTTVNNPSLRHLCNERLQLSSEQYFQRVLMDCQACDKQRPVDSVVADHLMSLTQIKGLPLPDQIKAIMLAAKVMQFKQLVHLLGGSGERYRADVLSLLPHYARLVQGCWVVRSDLLYPPDSRSPFTATSAESLIRARDYILWKFTHHRYVVRKELVPVIKLASDDLKAMLEQIARLRANCGWEFILPFDEDFINAHAEIFKTQQQLWQQSFEEQLSKKLPVTEQDKRINSTGLGHLMRSLSSCSAVGGVGGIHRVRRTSGVVMDSGGRRRRTQSSMSMSDSNLSDDHADVRSAAARRRYSPSAGAAPASRARKSSLAHSPCSPTARPASKDAKPLNKPVSTSPPRPPAVPSPAIPVAKPAAAKLTAFSPTRLHLVKHEPLTPTSLATLTQLKTSTSAHTTSNVNVSETETAMTASMATDENVGKSVKRSAKLNGKEKTKIKQELQSPVRGKAEGGSGSGGRGGSGGDESDEWLLEELRMAFEESQAMALSELLERLGASGASESALNAERLVAAAARVNAVPLQSADPQLPAGRPLLVVVKADDGLDDCRTALMQLLGQKVHLTSIAVKKHFDKCNLRLPDKQFKHFLKLYFNVNRTQLKLKGLV